MPPDFGRGLGTVERMGFRVQSMEDKLERPNLVSSGAEASGSHTGSTILLKSQARGFCMLVVFVLIFEFKLVGRIKAHV